MTEDGHAIVEKLDQILKLLALPLIEGKKNNQAAKFLKGAGLDNKAIASILGISEASVRATLSNNNKLKN